MPARDDMHANNTSQSVKLQTAVMPVLWFKAPVELRTVRPILQGRLGFADVRSVAFADLYADVIPTSAALESGSCLSLDAK
jgi:hypothetical protein